MPGDPLYDTDFYTWTQRQAELLQQSGDNRLDREHLAEEVADLGRSELRACESHLLQALIHLAKLAASTSEQPQGHWEAEVDGQLVHARKAFSPGMRQHIDLALLWQSAVRIANRQLADYAEDPVPKDLSCPFTLHDLLAPDFEPADARLQIERAIAAHGTAA
jgi:hypothetical protein